MPAPASTLTAIRTKVRRLTRTPNAAQMPDVDIDEYINTFIVYDLPEHLRLFNLHRPFTFYTNPYQSTYPTDTASFGVNPLAANNPLYNFQNKIISVNQPVYIGGYQSFFSQSREQFFGMYPQVNSINSIGTTGDGVRVTYTGNVNTNLVGTSRNGYVLLQGEVLFSSINTAGAGLSLIDVPVIDPLTGNPTVNGNLYVPGLTPATPPTVVTANNTINYRTGVFTITFPSAPAFGAAINSQTVPQIITIPQALLFFNNTFIVRPVPDQSYRVNIETYVRPTYLAASGQMPELEEWWQYIAYGASKKIFEDRMDLESVQNIMPEFKKQEMLCQRRTIVQNTNERVSTIYTEQVGVTSGGWGWGSGSNL